MTQIIIPPSLLVFHVTITLLHCMTVESQLEIQVNALMQYCNVLNV